MVQGTMMTMQSGISKGFSGLTGVVGGAVGGIGKSFTGLVGVVGGAVGGIKNWLTGMASHMRWASLFVGYAALGVTKNIIGLAASVEQAGIAFKTLVGEQAGKELLSWLTQYSLVTPVTRQQLMELTQTMLGYNHTAAETKKAMMAVVETASALGITETRLSAITYNLGQIATSTTVSYREFRDLQKQGVNTAKLLAGAINDGTLKLEGFAQGATIAGGASKKLTTAYGKAKEVLEDNTWKQGQLNDQLKKAKDKYGEASWQVQKAVEAQGDFNEKVAQANEAIADYSRAEGQRGKVISKTKKSLMELTREQQEMILKMNTGKEIALALEEQMIKTYGGAAARQVKTLSGLISNFGDVMQYVIQRAMGISIEGEVQIGGAFDKIRNAAAKVIEFLIDNVDKISNFFNTFLSNKHILIGLAAFLSGTLFAALSGILAPVLLMASLFGGLGIAASKLYEELKKGSHWANALAVGLTAIGTAFVTYELVIQFQKLKAAIVAFNLAIGPWGWLFIALGIGAAILVEKLGGLEEVMNKIKSIDATQFFNSLKEGMTFVQGKIQPLINMFGTMKDRLGQILSGAGISGEFGRFINFFSETSSKVGWYSTRIVQIVGENWQKLKNFLAFGGTEGDATIVQALEGIWNRLKPIKEALEPVFEHMMVQFRLTGEILKSQVAPAFSALIEVLKPFWEALKPELLQLVKNILISVAVALGIVISVILAIITGLASGLANALPYIAQALEGIIQFFRGFIQLVTAIMTGDWGLAIEGFKQMAKGAFDFVTNVFMAILKFISGFVKGVIAFFVGLYNALIGKSIIPDMVNAILDWFGTLKDKAFGLVGDIVKGIKDKFMELVNGAKDWGKDMIRNMIEGIKNAIRGAGKLAGKLVGGLGISMEELSKMQHGGIVPGAVGQPVPIMAHGGERITPRGSNREAPFMGGGGGGVTVNMNGPITMDSPERVKQLAEEIMRIQGRQSELAKYGVGF